MTQAQILDADLAEAAKLLLADYMTDAELTTFTALDGEPFYTTE